MEKNLSVFEDNESQVRSYCRAFPSVFSKAKGSLLYDEFGNSYIDFLCGAGAVNYGHNNPIIKDAIMAYLDNDGIAMGLDFHTQAKREFIQTFNEQILMPRNLRYRMQFTSPTGTSVVESAIKLARKFTGRENIIAFTNGYHGMTGVSLSVTGNRYNRQAISYSSVSRLPFFGYMGEGFDEIAHYRKLLLDNSSGVDLPAAFILETVQGEGGINVASEKWLQGLMELAKEFGALVIVDDVQAGCGRTGKFFSFERAGIEPDLVCLSKSIGGFGIPMALLLFKDALDVWGAGEDNGTFRGNNMAFVAAAAMVNGYWHGFEFEQEIAQRAAIVSDFCHRMHREHSGLIKIARGLGLMQGMEFFDENLTAQISKLCFKNGLVIERAGDRDQVLKIMPALNVDLDVLRKGLDIVEYSIAESIGLSVEHFKPFGANHSVSENV
ncbi:aminotransferase, class III [Teredinibacter turnerae T7901]|uniref:Diaminobutyrate--2-oxoglutarate transaminase n=1 Tax=Teredinibacter turnerae (strain ATCC 39867 / T7901) TaxID=377629 RepID=C5BIM8_TERTT|nr:diaminobutyrate--2-oxoglutarate transaminase [Teredinibacter turnerae]ACR10639.1 aminotransferase, class III [Teredinibacter turnerae T7901]